LKEALIIANKKGLTMSADPTCRNGLLKYGEAQKKILTRTDLEIKYIVDHI
jgi:2-dehydro-3-deoxygluconokinase